MKPIAIPGFPLRLAWRPSRWSSAALLCLGVLALAVPWLSDLPGMLRWPLAAAILLWTLIALRRQRRQPPRLLRWPAPDAPAALIAIADDPDPDPPTAVVRSPSRPSEPGPISVEIVAIVLRGPLALVRLRTTDGRTRVLHWWPDTLAPTERRALRLARSAQQRASLLPLVAG